MLQQNLSNAAVTPLLMGFTPLTKIQEGCLDESFVYDDIMQIAKYNMMAVGTKCLKTTTTSKTKDKPYSHIDNKNEIDDRK